MSNPDDGTVDNGLTPRNVERDAQLRKHMEFTRWELIFIREAGLIRKYRLGVLIFLLVYAAVVASMFITGMSGFQKYSPGSTEVEASYAAINRGFAHLVLLFAVFLLVRACRIIAKLAEKVGMV